MKTRRFSPRSIVLISLFAVLTAVGSLVAVPVPLSPVPITLQTMFCVLSGAILGPARGAYSQAAYIMLGAAGLPVFSRGGSGIGCLLGPTGGYILGFIGAAYVSGILSKKGRYIIGMSAGMLVIYSLGIIHLKFVTGLSWVKTIMVGAAPFIPADVLKIIIASGVYSRLKKAGMLETAV